MEEILTSLHEREDIQIESSYSDRKESTLVNTLIFLQMGVGVN